MFKVEGNMKLITRMAVLEFILRWGVIVYICWLIFKLFQYFKVLV